MLKGLHEKRTDGVTINLKDIKNRQKEQFKYYDTRLRERIDKVDQVKAVLREDMETRKELSLLRKADQEENLMRGQNIHNIYKQRLVEKIIEKKERADKIKEQQMRISDLCRTVRQTHNGGGVAALTAQVSPKASAKAIGGHKRGGSVA